MAANMWTTSRIKRRMEKESLSCPIVTNILAAGRVASNMIQASFMIILKVLRNRESRSMVRGRDW